MLRNRIAAGALAGIFCLGAVCACGNQSASGSGVVEDNGPMTLFLSREDEWLLQLVDSCSAAAEANGYTLEVVDAENDSDKQLEQIKENVTEGESAFLVNMVDPSRAEEIIEAAGNRNVVFINRAPTDLSVLDDNHIYVGSEEETAGELQGQVLAEHCQSEGMTEIRYLLLHGPDALESSEQRAQAVLDTLEETNNFTLTAVHTPISADYDRQTAEDEVSELIATDTDLESNIDVVISTDDAMALGAVQAMNDAGWQTLPIIIGVDGIPDALNAVNNGLMMMTAYQDADRQAETAVSVANNLNHGYAYDQNIIAADRVDDYIFWISFQSVTEDNIGDFLNQE